MYHSEKYPFEGRLEKVRTQRGDVCQKGEESLLLKRLYRFLRKSFLFVLKRDFNERSGCAKESQDNSMRPFAVIDYVARLEI